jgi:hypothetical protein
MKLVRNKIFEDFLGSYTTRYNTEFEIYLNPTSIKRMGGWVRAISDQTGDLYVGTPSEIIHDDILEQINDVSEFDIFDNFNAIAWQQKDNENTFYLAESYSPDYFEGTDDDEYGGEFIYEEILPAYYNVSKNNPQYKFVLLSINNNEI